ncbi:endothelin-converting enzyme 1 [Plakobranchus ocellatus]|uniref:Endothelin-converting enzyme 1 n=1 Tax=Plakobranchus ocellatus TaxID=259542 RepID=A0AAV4BT29_9GAST|nr:endothelin-converting enzyme 1 [Plakobranchus ocellatus]
MDSEIPAIVKAARKGMAKYLRMPYAANNPFPVSPLLVSSMRLAFNSAIDVENFEERGRHRVTEKLWEISRARGHGRIFLCTASPQQADLRLLGSPSGQGACSGARSHDRGVPADLRANSLTTVPPTPRLWER